MVIICIGIKDSSQISKYQTIKFLQEVTTNCKFGLFFFCFLLIFLNNFQPMNSIALIFWRKLYSLLNENHFYSKYKLLYLTNFSFSSSHHKSEFIFHQLQAIEIELFIKNLKRWICSSLLLFFSFFFNNNFEISQLFREKKFDIFNIFLKFSS